MSQSVSGDHEMPDYAAELAELRAKIAAVEALCNVVRTLQKPDPDTGDRAVSFFALLDALDPDDAALSGPQEPGEPT